MSARLNGQEIIVQSNNATDLKHYEKLIKASNINTLKGKLENVIKNNPDYSATEITIQVTFFDPAALGGMKLKSSHSLSSNYINVWKTTYLNENRIMFFFEKQNNLYAFKDFVVTQNIEDGQIPDLVINYIKEQILHPENNDAAKIIYKGLNAVKNAYDRRFQQKLIGRSPVMLFCRYYYKGYTCISTDSYYFQNTTVNRPDNLKQTVLYLHPGVYNNVYLQKWNSYRATVFDVLLGHDLSVAFENDVLPPNNISIEQLYINEGGVYNHLKSLNINFDTKDLFNYSATHYNSYEDALASNNFPYLEELKNSKEILVIDLSGKKKVAPLMTDNSMVPVAHSTLYNLRHDKIEGANTSDLINGTDNPQADEITPEQVWGHPFWTKLQTWCNVYAQYLSRYVYGVIDGDFLVPSKGGNMNANSLFDHFNGSPHYKELPKNEEIWTKYINKGYPVYFSQKKDGGSGHIETGFPEILSGSKYNKQKFSDVENRNRLLGYDKFVIGAGSIVGFKSYDEYKWIRNTETKAFLALQYLANEYE
jgi:hypothetical protein